MDELTAELLTQAAILLFAFGALLSLAFSNYPMKCNILSNLINGIAALLLMAVSLAQLLLRDTAVSFDILKSSIPYISIQFRIDNLSAFFLLVLSVLVLCVSIYSVGYLSHYYGKRNLGLFHFLYSSFILSMVFVFASTNAVSFYLAWEAMSLLSYFLVIFESEQERNQKAGTLYIVMTHIGTAFLLIGFMISFSYTHSFDLSANTNAIPDAAKNIIFLCYVIGFGTKAGAIPTHIWLPYAHPAAPSNVSALMSGIMIKTACYGLVRFVLDVLGIEQAWWGILLLCIGIVSAVLGVAYAFVESDIKRLLAYSSIENIGIILIGLGISFIAFAEENPFVGVLGLTAALFHTFNHALFKCGLFLGAGSIHYATHTKDINRLGGLIKSMPVTALMMLLFSLAITAIIPLNGFVGEWLMYQSFFSFMLSAPTGLSILSLLSIAALGLSGALAVACFVKLFGISFLGVPRSKHAIAATEVPVSMNIGMGILGALCLGIGLFPFTVLRLIEPVTTNLVGFSIIGKLHGGMIVMYDSLELSQSRVSPLTALIALAGIVLLSAIVIRILYGKYREHRSVTWDCGFKELNSRMQYSADGYSKPLKIVFKLLFRPSRTTTITGDFYHPTSIEYRTASESVFEKYMYLPAYAAVKKLSRRIKFVVQTGKIHNYLIYIFATILLFMAYNKFF